jgi:hypothetical protein
VILVWEKGIVYTVLVGNSQRMKPLGKPRSSCGYNIKVYFKEWFRERASMLRYTYIACLVFRNVLRKVNGLFSVLVHSRLHVSSTAGEKELSSCRIPLLPRQL